MARTKKPSGRLHKGPFTGSQLEEAIKKDGWTRIKGKTNHPAYEHPTKTGKVNISEKWAGVKYGHQTFESVAAQAGLSKRQLLRLLNE